MAYPSYGYNNQLYPSSVYPSGYNGYNYNQQLQQYQPQYQQQIPQIQPVQQTMQQSVAQPVQQQTQNNYGLPGKIVESYDIAKTQEIPIGSTAIFPQADFSAIHVKAWNNDGTTKVITYKPEIQDEPETIDTTIVSSLNEIYDSIANLEKKLDEISSQVVGQIGNQVKVTNSSPTPMKRREVKNVE